MTPEQLEVRYVHIARKNQNYRRAVRQLQRAYDNSRNGIAWAGSRINALQMENRDLHTRLRERGVKAKEKATPFWTKTLLFLFGIFLGTALHFLFGA